MLELTKYSAQQQRISDDQHLKDNLISQTLILSHERVSYKAQRIIFAVQNMQISNQELLQKTTINNKSGRGRIRRNTNWPDNQLLLRSSSSKA